MRVRPALIPAALVALTVAVAGCAGTDAPAASGPSESTGPAPTSSADASAEVQRIEVQRIGVQVAGGRVSGTTGRVPVTAGTPVTLVITSDVADQVHVHGYDLEAELAPGAPAEVTFDATIPGVFEVELHEAGTVLLSLQVS